MSVEVMPDTTPMDASAVPETPAAAPAVPSGPTVREATDPDGTQIVCVSLHGTYDNASAVMTLDKADWVRLTAEFGNRWGRKGRGKFSYVTALTSKPQKALTRLLTGASSGAFVRFRDLNRLNFRQKNLQVVITPEVARLTLMAAKAAGKPSKSRGAR